MLSKVLRIFRRLLFLIYYKICFNKLKKVYSWSFIFVYIFISLDLSIFYLYIPDVKASEKEPVDSDRTEVESLRSENSKTYQYYDASEDKVIYEKVIHADKIHYLSGGEYEEVDNNIIYSPSDEFEYSNGANDFSFQAGEFLNEGVRYQKGNDICQFNLDSIENLSLNDVKAQVNENVISYLDIYEGIDLEFTVNSDGFNTEVVFAGESNLKDEVVFNLKNCNYDNFDEAVMSDESDTAYVEEEIVKEDGRNILVLKPDYSLLNEINGEVRVDPSISVSTYEDVFITPSTRYGNRRALIIGTYTDYTVPGNPTFHTTRSLINFGRIDLQGNSDIESAYLELWHYGTNRNQQGMYVARVTSGWNEQTSWPGPSYEGNYGSYTFPYYNSNNTAQERNINIDNSLVSYLQNDNYGIMLRNFNENARGEAVCARHIPIGPCKTGMEPKIIITYHLNQPPNAPDLDTPDQNWELGPNENYNTVNCSTKGIGEGCSINFRVKTEDPDNTFPLVTTLELSNETGSKQEVSITQESEGWFEYIVSLKDGRWSWRAKTVDTNNLVSNWSVTKNFIVDTTAPSIPVMIQEPEFTGGNQNTVRSNESTDNIIDNVKYEFEAYDSEDHCCMRESSGWIDATEFTFGTLQNNALYYFHARAKDKLENISNWSDNTFSIQDSVPPVISNINIDYQRISPKNQDGQFDSAILKMSIKDSHFKSAEVKLINEKKEIVRTYSITNDYIELVIDGKDSSGNWLDDGAYNLYITAFDKAENKTENNENYLVIDNTNAIINISYPIEGAWFNTDNINIKGISEINAEVYIKNLNTGSETKANIDPSSGIFEGNIDLTLGINVIELRVFDAFGNMNNISLNLYRENSEPQAVLTYPDTSVNNSNLNLEFNLQDDGFIQGENKFVSGIDISKTYLSLKLNEKDEFVLINEGTDISDIGHFETDCSGKGDFSLSSKPNCQLRYIFEKPISPDGIYGIYLKVYDMAGNETIYNSSFTLDSQTYLAISDPSDGSLFNHSRINIKGTAEKNALVKITGGVEELEFYINPERIYDNVSILNCRKSEDIFKDEICDFEVSNYQLKYDIFTNRDVLNEVKYTIKDIASNEYSIIHKYLVNLFAVNLSINTEMNYFSPNGDGVQDGINFIEMITDACVDIWEIRIYDGDGKIIRILNGKSNLPGNVYWNGKYNSLNTYDEGSDYIQDGKYSYDLYIKTTDGLEFSTAKSDLYAKKNFDNDIIITYPKDNFVTTKGVVNVRGETFKDANVKICVDVPSLNSSCDFEFYTNVNEAGYFSMIVPLFREENTYQTENYIFAQAFDEYGNVSKLSNKVKVIIDTKDPFISIVVCPTISGVNNEADYRKLLEKLDRGEDITNEDIEKLKTILFKSKVSANTERVKFSYTKYNNLTDLPSDITYSYIGYANGRNETKLNEEYDKNLDFVICKDNECEWDFYYPVPPVTGGIYEIEFDGKKGENIQKLYASALIDGTLPLTPVILDINKVVGENVFDINWFQSKYYSNSEYLEIKGISDPDTNIKINDQSNNLICEAKSNSVGLFVCRADTGTFYKDLDKNIHELSLKIIASDGLNEVNSAFDTIVVLDKIKPIIEKINSPKLWLKSGDIGSTQLNANEELKSAYIKRNDNTYYDMILYKDYKGANGSFIVPGFISEGLYRIQIGIFDLAGNKTQSYFEYFIDNTTPDTSNIDTTNWGKYNGIYASKDFPSAGRLVPEYVTANSNLYLSGLAEKYSVVKLYVNGAETATINVDNNNCSRVENDKVTFDKVVVKSGEKCKWDTVYNLNGEKGYVFSLKAFDRAGNESLISNDEIVYLDITNPDKPKVKNISSESYNPIPDFDSNPITRDLEITLDAFSESLSDIEYWFYDTKGNEIKYEHFINNGNGRYERVFKLGSKRDENDCIKNVNGNTKGICEDGIYKVKVLSTDAAGNNSDMLEFLIERDTVEPKNFTVGNLYEYASDICADANGEDGSFLVDNNYKGSVSLVSKRFTLLKNYEFNKLYKFGIQLQDRAKNKSKNIIKEIQTLSYSRGDIIVDSAENPWADKSGDTLESIKFDVIIKPDESYEIVNLQIPSPILTRVHTTQDDKVEVYGVAIEKYHRLRVNIRRQYMTYNEAAKACNVGIFINSSDRQCMESKMGIESLSSWVWQKEKECLFFPYCLEQKKKNVREEHVINDQDFQVEHVMISFYKDIEGNPYIGSLWNDSADGRFNKVFNLNQEVGIGDLLKAKAVIFGVFEFDGVKIDYRGINNFEASKNNGLGSEFSNLEKVEENLEKTPWFNDTLSVVETESNISQNAFGEYSHVDNTALDITGNYGTKLYATMSGKATYDGCGGVRITNEYSVYEVLYAHVVVTSTDKSGKTTNLYKGANIEKDVEVGDTIAYIGKERHVHYEIYRKDLPYPNNYVNRVDCNHESWNQWRGFFKLYLDILNIPYDNITMYKKYMGTSLYNANGASVWSAKSNCPQL